MGCSQCEKRRRASLEKRRQLIATKVERLQKGCDAGDQRSCLELQRLMAQERYKGTTGFNPELHHQRQLGTPG